MSDQDYRYFWTDRPSPLHELLDAHLDALKEARRLASDLANEIGATNAVGRSCIEGFIFDKKPDDSWTYAGSNNAGEKFYKPKRNSKAGRALSERMKAIKIPTSEQILRKADLYHMLFRGRYMCHSTIGWRDDRIYVVLPVADSMVGCDMDDAKPVVAPDYLTECKKWEMDRFFDEGRQPA